MLVLLETLHGRFADDESTAALLIRLVPPMRAASRSVNLSKAQEQRVADLISALELSAGEAAAAGADTAPGAPPVAPMAWGQSSGTSWADDDADAAPPLAAL